MLTCCVAVLLYVLHMSVYEVLQSTPRRRAVAFVFRSLIE